MYLGRSVRTAFFTLLVSLCVAAATDSVDFTVFGRIKFSVPGDWPVLASKSSAEKTVFAFQIPNAADEGTPDSSNLSIISSFLTNAQDREAFEKKASSTDHNAKQRKLVEGWLCSTFSSMQRSTEYVVWDCYRAVGDCGVYVRLAWPHLPKNPADYDNQMETVLSGFLTSVGPSKKPSK
jgi:hypothetical protein